MGPRTFSKELQAELKLALQDYGIFRNPAASERLAAAAERVSIEACTLGMSPVAMMAELRVHIDSMPGDDPLALHVRRAAYGRLMSACIRCYLARVGDHDTSLAEGQGYVRLPLDEPPHEAQQALA